MNNIFFFVFSFTLLCQSCNVAKFSSMPKAASDIDFNKYSNGIKVAKEPLLTIATTNEFFVKIDRVCTELEILDVIGKAYTANHYGFSKFNKTDKAVFAERGARLNEWKSIAGVYYLIDTKTMNTQFYILVKITQDITGGWKENRAKKIGLSIEKELINKK